MDKNTKEKTGAVLVLGGGIAGVQASLDLANSGFKVYLVERSPAIGGMMSHLDKTFPTGDCATCTVSPKLVECARNLNIEILTLSDLDGLEGEPGNFKAMVRRYPRYIDESKCTGCQECVTSCPVKILNDFDRGLGTRKAISNYYSQAVPNIVSIIKQGHSPCKNTCPAHINVQGYIQLIKKGEYLKAVNLIRERNPLSAICGRVCTHPCEEACTLGNADDPVAIRLLKRFASDKEMEMIASGEIALPPEKTIPSDAKKVAVIGAGPSGLTVSDDLAGNGFAVTVYESRPAAGGMLRWGIPEYRLPKKVLDHEIELIRRKGVSFVYNCNIGKDITLDEIRANFDAVYLSVGAQVSRWLGIDGEDMKGISHGIEFLRSAGSDTGKPVVKGKVIVIGGGNVAIDVARAALRLGADQVELVSLEQRNGMPAYPEEIEATLSEGIIIRNGWGPRRFIGNGVVTDVEFRKCTRVFDDNGQFSPVYDDNMLETSAVDMVIIAIGQKVEPEFLEHIGAEKTRGGISVDSVTLETSLKGVFAGGDAASGPASVIEAVAAGKRATESIVRYLKGENIRADRFEDTVKPIPSELLPKTDKIEKKPRAKSGELDVLHRISGFYEVETGISGEQALAEAKRCLNCALCSECQECVLTCQQHAVDHDMEERIVEIDVGSVILTPGFEEFLAEANGEFGYGRYPNVITSVQFERMLSASGPFEGHIVRRTDGKPAKRVAFIQCVGSRDSRCENEYCSSICCMASTKQALVAREHLPGLESSIFYMDIRAYGKEFDQYYERAKNTEDITYIKSIPSRILQVPGNNDLRLRFVGEQGKLKEQDFDLVVLAVGLEPGTSIKETAGRLGLELNEHGFCRTNRLAPLETSRPGVFVAGTFQEPKDIPETVTQASGAASMAIELLAPSRNQLVTRKSYPDEHDITDEKPRIGVFVCHCGNNIAGVVNVEQVVEAVAGLPDVILATHTLYTCSDTSLINIRNAIREHKLNRIVVASCTPRTHEPLFRETLREAGINPYLFELANIRDQCSWVHSTNPEAATVKAAELVRMAIARARYLRPLVDSSLEVIQSASIIGGGLSGMTAALALAEQGFKVNLVERSRSFGGNLNHLYYTLEHNNIQEFTAGLIKRVTDNPNIKVLLSTEVTSVAGHIGKFEVNVSRKEKQMTILSGVVIVATGSEPAKTGEFMYGVSGKVMNQIELEQKLHEGTLPDLGNVVMIQCAGSRNDENSFCSRICCSSAVKNALRIKELYPKAKVFVLYRDIRTYGFREVYYKKARAAGVVFIRYSEDHPPSVFENNGLRVSLDSPDFPENIEIETDYVVLSTGMVAPESNKQLSDMLKVPLNSNGFYVEAHMKLRPVDFATEGIFLCGLAHSPKFIDENISQARAAAARASTVISKTLLSVSAQVSQVDQNKCISCMTCVKACPFTAPYINIDNKAQIEAAKCMGCGICASECPARAIKLNNYDNEQFENMITTLLSE